jgi:hypothetical protein
MLRSVAIIILTRGPARRLGVAEEFAERRHHWRHSGHAGEHSDSATTGMAALLAEMGRRDWL